MKSDYHNMTLIGKNLSQWLQRFAIYHTVSNLMQSFSVSCHYSNEGIPQDQGPLAAAIAVISKKLFQLELGWGPLRDRHHEVTQSA
jgi:hypothetical protein